MKKWIIYIIMVLLVLQTAFAIEECMREQLNKDIPCLLVTTWTPPNDCNTYSANLYNESGDFLDIHTFGYIGDSGRCNVTFNHTELGQYYINSSIETWNVTVQKENEMLSIIITIGILIAFFIALAILNKDLPLKFICFGLSMIEIIIMVAIIYANESGKSYLGLLKINFYAMLIIGFGLGMATLIIRSIDIVNPIEEKNPNRKWR